MQRNHETGFESRPGVPVAVGANSAVGPPRRRLEPAARIQLILDAALQKFSARGYEATRMDDIAAGAGLSKGGLYAHFAGKDEIFQALLDRSLPAIAIDENALAACTSVRSLIENLVDPFYEGMKDPKALITLRLLISESSRVADVATRWRAQVPDNHAAVFRRALEPWIARGEIRSTILLDEPWLAFAPVLHPIIGSLVCGTRPSGDDMQRIRAAHVRMLCELLEASGPSDASRAPNE